jgi:cell division protein FtsI (penicillin-binding protein 3)
MAKSALKRLVSLFHLSAGEDARAVSRSRLSLALIGFFGLYAIVGGRLVMLAAVPDADVKAKVEAEAALSVRRPDIVDNHGRLLAADVVSTSLYAEPRRMIDPDEAADLVMTVFPDLNAEDLRKRFASDRGFEWVKREITPEQKAEIFRLGVPGLGFLTEKRRIYPNGPLVSHILGAVNIDNHGIAGLEKYLDTAGYLVTDASKPKPEPIRLPLDLGVQHAVRDELIKAMAKYSAIAASGTVMDVNTGEIIALVSLPDFDPNNAADALKPNNINRVNVGVFEMGSTFKALTVAMALDSGRIRMGDAFDARTPLHYGRFRINDFHPTRRVLTVPEVFLHSSNIGTAKMALMLGVDAHKAFLKKMGQLDRLRTEMPESSAPIVPRNWGELNTVTISFGHGLSVAPIQTVMATGALVNGGILIPPTFMSRTPQQAADLGQRVIKPETSDQMRYLLRLNAQKGSAKKADVPGYRVGGKTGTAEKVFGGRYVKDRVMTAFTAVFPADKPQYTLLLVLDEPKPLKETYGFRTSGWNVVPAAYNVVERIAPLLGVEPKPDTMNPPPVLASILEQAH